MQKMLLSLDDPLENIQLQRAQQNLKAKQMHREMEGSYENLMKTRCLSLSPWPDLRVLHPSLLFPLLSSNLLCKIHKKNKSSWVWNCGGNSRMQSQLLGLEKFNQYFSRWRKCTVNNMQASSRAVNFEMGYSRLGPLCCFQSSPGCHEMVLEISCRKEKMKEVGTFPLQASSTPRPGLKN